MTPAAPHIMAGEAGHTPLKRGLILATASALVIGVALGAFWIDGRWGIQLPTGLRWPGMLVMDCVMALIVWAEVEQLSHAQAPGGFRAILTTSRQDSFKLFASGRSSSEFLRIDLRWCCSGVGWFSA